MRTLIWFIYFWTYIIVIYPIYLKVKKLGKDGDVKAHDELTRRIVRVWARRMVGVAGGKVTVQGLENLPCEPCVYVANHSSYFDIPLCLGYLGDDTKPLVAKKQIEKLPLVRDWMKELHCVFINRDNPREAVSALNEAASWTQQGYSMVVFPEGTRTPDGEIKEFKAGAYKIAEKGHLPVVPVCIKGTADLMGCGSLKITPASVTLEILPKIDTTNYTKQDWKALPALTQEIVTVALNSN